MSTILTREYSITVISGSVSDEYEFVKFYDIKQG